MDTVTDAYLRRLFERVHCLKRHGRDDFDGDHPAHQEEAYNADIKLGGVGDPDIVQDHRSLMQHLNPLMKARGRPDPRAFELSQDIFRR